MRGALSLLLGVTVCVVVLHGVVAGRALLGAAGECQESRGQARVEHGAKKTLNEVGHVGIPCMALAVVCIIAASAVDGKPKSDV